MNAAGWLSILGALVLVFTACDAKQASPKAPADPVQPTSSARPPLPLESIRTPGRPDLASEHRDSPTKLLDPGPSPQPFDTRPNPDGLETVHYVSEGRNLKAWLHRGKPGAPVFVYLHGGFAGDPEEAYTCPQFAEAGYTVLAPTYRGENGNPGSFELMFGEVRDAAAAVRYAHSLEGVDADRIVVFGHSIGAGTAALLATMDDVPAAMTGGAGGMYDPMAIEGFISQFGVVDPIGAEVTLRTPTTMLESMRIRHHAFTGEDDTGAHPGTTLGWLQSKGAKDHPLRVYDVPGDHFESLAPACAAFFELAEGRPSPVAARSPELLDAAGRDPALELYQGGVVWGEGPFGEAASQGGTGKTQIVRHQGGELAVPADATLDTIDEEGMSALAFETSAMGGALVVLQFPPDVQATLRPLYGAFSALMNMEPSAARFFFPGEDAVGLEARGHSDGKRVYVRTLVTREGAMMLTLQPADDPRVHGIVASLKPVEG